MKNNLNKNLFSTDQLYVQKFTITYCCVILCFSAFFTPQDFNLKVALIINILFFLIGSPYWFRNTQIPILYLNIISQISNTLASVWTCSFLGPHSHVNLVAIPQFILVLMMFDEKSRIKYILGGVCLVLLVLPLFPFVNEIYLDKRMKESHLVVLRTFIDISILFISVFQFKVIVENWRKTLEVMKLEKNKLLEESRWRHKLLKILTHDIKEPMVYTIQFLRKLRKNSNKDIDINTINQIENAQMVIRDIISNIENYSSKNFDMELPRSWISLNEVVEKVMPLFKSRLEEKSIRMIHINPDPQIQFYINHDSFIYQIFNNLISNAIKFCPRASCIELEALNVSPHHVRWIIRDHGPGIRKEALTDLLFSEIGPYGESGTGLGIKIAKTFAQKQGLEISWHSHFLENRIELFGTVIYLDQKNEDHLERGPEINL
jgi:signal transduction histidine kinase